MVQARPSFVGILCGQVASYEARFALTGPCSSLWP
jgi:hypothetical protein